MHFIKGTLHTLLRYPQPSAKFIQHYESCTYFELDAKSGHDDSHQDTPPSTRIIMRFKAFIEVDF